MKRLPYCAGEKSHAICPYCNEIVTTTFAMRDVVFDAAAVDVRNVLAGVCDSCLNVVSIPAQSVPGFDISDADLS
jgi:hypothetical protein